jgi:hypothetical protein
MRCDQVFCPRRVCVCAVLVLPFCLETGSLLFHPQRFYSIHDLPSRVSAEQKALTEQLGRGVDALTEACVGACDPELHEMLWDNVVLSGGSSMVGIRLCVP